MVLIDEIGNLPEQTSALGREHLGPGTFIESFARRSHRALNVFAVAFGNPRQDLPGCRIVGVKSFAGSGFHPLSTNEHLPGLFQEVGDVAVNFD